MRILVLAVALLAATAHAEGDGPRARWGGGLCGGFDMAYSPTAFSDAPGMGGGLYTRAGIQWDDRLHLEADLSAATLLFLGLIRAALLAGLTYDWLSVSAGPMVAANYSGFIEATPHKATYAGVAMRIDFHFWQHVTDTGSRWAFTGSLSAEAGYALQVFSGNHQVPNGFAWGAYTSIGPTWY